MTGSIKWGASGGSTVPSTISINGVSLYYDLNLDTVDLVVSSTSTSAGSFASESTTFSGLRGNTSGYLIDSKCSSGGVKSIKFGKPFGTVTGSVSI